MTLKNVTSTAVVIATYNGEKYIEKCLLSLIASTIPVHIIVIDNASTDSTKEILSNKFPDVEAFYLNKNYGFGIANNIGIKRSIDLGVEFTFLLNQDALIEKSAIEKLINYLNSNEAIGAASPLHCSPDFNKIDQSSTKWYFPKYANDFLSDAILKKQKNSYEIHGVNAAAWLVRNTTFISAGGFDPLFFMYAEDDDILYRFSQHNIRFALLTDAKIVHLREKSLNSPSGFISKVKKVASRKRSELICDIKKFGLSRFFMLRICISKGLLRPLADFIIDANIECFFGSIAATIQTIYKIQTIHIHAKLCASAGPHFLDKNSTKIIDHHFKKSSFLFL